MTWADGNYKYKKKLTIDHTKVGGDEIDFPILLSITDNDLRDTSNSGHVESSSGYDIVFYNSAEDTLLKHEIERYVNTSGLLVYWVKVLSVSCTVDTDIYIYYGKSGVVVNPSTTDTWDSSFELVYHMKDNTTSTINDSTSNARNGTKLAANTPNEVDGKIGKCQDFVDDYVLYNTGFEIEQGTICVWFNSDDWTANYAVPFGTLNDPAISTKGYAQQYPNPNIVKYYGAGTAPCTAATWGAISSGSWQHLAVKHDGTNLVTFLNSAQVTSIAEGNSTHLIKTAPYYVGSDAATDRNFNGRIDEFRISSTARSGNWIGTSYETQNNPAGFMSWGAEESNPVVGADIYYHDGTNNVELQRDDASPIKLYNGTAIIGLKIGATNDANASPIYVYDGGAVKAILKMP